VTKHVAFKEEVKKSSNAISKHKVDKGPIKKQPSMESADDDEDEEFSDESLLSENNSHYDANLNEDELKEVKSNTLIYTYIIYREAKKTERRCIYRF
jgi:hypothetical protein